MQPLKDDEVDAFYEIVKGLNVGVFSNGYYKIFNDDKYKIEVFFQAEVYIIRKYAEITITYKEYFK